MDTNLLQLDRAAIQDRIKRIEEALETQDDLSQVAVHHLAGEWKAYKMVLGEYQSPSVWGLLHRLRGM